MKNEIVFDSGTMTINGEVFTKQQILDSFADNESNDVNLLTIKWESNRNFDGICEQILINATKFNIDQVVSELIDTNVDFGEIAGKHSHVCGLIESSDIKISSKRSEIVQFGRENPTGYANDGHSFLEQILNYHDNSKFQETLKVWSNF